MAKKQRFKSMKIFRIKSIPLKKAKKVEVQYKKGGNGVLELKSIETK
jgi:hypothetical protein